MAYDRFWSPNEPVPDVPADNCQPAVATVGETLNLVWSSNRVLYHSVRLDTGWSSPVRIIAGEQPSLAATPDGKLHCLFANPFVGNWEIYHTTFCGEKWSLPKPVSRTSGVSSHPSVVTDGDGALHAVWSDTTPGESVIYHGTLGPAVIWSSAPIANGRGCFPTLAAVSGGDVCVAWQDRASQSNAFDVYCAMLHEGRWSLPDIVSDSAYAHSVKPSITANSRGDVHLVWLEEASAVFEVRHSDRRVNGWSQPVAISTRSQDCRQARIIANPQGYLQVVWIEGNTLHHRVRPPDYDSTWWVPQTAQGEYREASDLGTVVDPTGELHVVWSGYGDGETRLLYYAKRSAIFAPAQHRQRP
jgi:hypothetical protein